jgi:hypothetical protein
LRHSFGPQHSGKKHERFAGRDPPRVASVRHDPNLDRPRRESFLRGPFRCALLRASELWGYTFFVSPHHTFRLVIARSEATKQSSAAAWIASLRSQ